MGPLVIIVALELVITSGIIGFSSHPFSNVLGIQKIAQVEENTEPDQTQPADQSSTAAPAQPEQSQAPVSYPPPAAPVPTSSESPATTPEQTMPSEKPNLSPSEQTTPEQTPSPSETPNLFEQMQESSSPNPQFSAEPSPSPTSVETGATQTQAVLAPDDLINSPENINNKSVEEVKKEDTQLNQTTDPEKQTKLLVDFATDKVKDMNNFSKSDDFTSTNFAAQRFNEQMDKAISNLEKISPKDQPKLKQQLVNFCNQADKVLRTVELSVPEEGEQDLEIARGQCQELNL